MIPERQSGILCYNVPHMNRPVELREYILTAVIPKMRSAIEAAGGNEVFFLGKTDKSLIVKSVSVLARGDGESVPAIIKTASLGEVVIHNHPEGSLCPSKNDLAVASELGNRGVGFYIVDNAVENIYPVVEPSHEEELQQLNPERLASYIVPGGAVSKVLKDYEFRNEQRMMMEKVVLAFNNDLLAVIEAGTGTGKSLAYLIPAISWSLLNRERVVISTNTINLQEQLMGKDIPLLQRVKELQCRAVLVKGRGNYICLRKLASVKEEGQLLMGEEGRELEEIAAWAEKSSDGSLADLSFIPRRENWERVCAEADQCTRLHCPFYAKCFFYGARRRASQANLLVVNHHLLMADLAVRSRTESYDRTAVLPRFHRIVIDEAQHLEDVATDYLGFQISKFGLLKILRRLRRKRDSSRGLLPFLAAKLRYEAGGKDVAGSSEALKLVEIIVAERLDLEKRIESSMDRIMAELRDYCAREGEENGRALRIVPGVTASPFWRDVFCPVLREMMSALEPFSARLGEMVKLLDSFSEKSKEIIESPRVELVAMRRRLAHHLDCFSFFMDEHDDYCRWLEMKKGRRGEWVRFCAAPLDISEGMREAVYRRFRTVLMTSATLTVGGRFDYVRARLGLDGLPEGKLESLALSSPFDHRRQAFVGAPTGVAIPDRPGYKEMLEEVVRSAVTISRGRTFVLFTSYRLLQEMHERLREDLSERKIIALVQGSDNRTSLLNRFRREERAVLFATSSFWEGVDVRGKALQCVIITRLPFRVPSEPIQQARMETIEQAGGDAFMDYSVPQAVIRFRQGFGRLIRHRDDVGAVLILDGRVHTRRYGRLFLNSLPEVSVCSRDAGGMLAEMERFFDRLRGGN